MSEQKFDEAAWTIQDTFLGILLTLVPWILLAFLLSSTNGASTSGNTLSPQADWTSAIIVFFFDTCIEATFLIAPAYFALRAFRSIKPRLRLALRTLGFRRFRVGNAIAWVFVLFLGILAVNLVYQYLITSLHLHLQTNDQALLEQSKHAPITTYATLLVAVFVAPLCEEVFFRGFVLPGLLKGMAPGVAIVLSALIFGVAHADIGSFVVLVVIGLALAFLRLRTNSIWPGIMLHALNNGFSAVLLVLSMQGIIK